MTPYRFGRNTIIERLEEWVADPTQATALREELAAHEGPPDGPQGKLFLDSLKSSDRRHLERDVYGIGAGVSQDDRARGAERFRVFHAGLKAALDLALETEEQVAPIDMYWGCGQPLNQAWVGWNTHDGRRRVSLILFSDVPAMGWSSSDFRPRQSVLTGAPKGLVVIHEDRQNVASLNDPVVTDS